MYNIVIIGVGSLGKRHLSSILNSSLEFIVYCYDIDAHALDSFVLNDNDQKKRIKMITSFSELPETIDFALFSMVSAGRREMFDKLIDSANVKTILFEKVLFQRVEDYEYVKIKLEELDIKAWVNCSRRQMDCYRSLRDELTKAKEMSIIVTGGDWGMACNAIHELDLVSFLSGSDDLKLDPFDFIPGIYESKRKGYKEIYGTISGSCGRCKRFVISCMKDTNVPDILLISSDVGQYYILEGKKKMISIAKKNDYELREEPFIMPYQSQMTQFVMEEILNHGSSRLPTYIESAKLHLEFLKPLLAFFNGNGMEGDVCPIT